MPTDRSETLHVYIIIQLPLDAPVTITVFALISPSAAVLGLSGVKLPILVSLVFVQKIVIVRGARAGHKNCESRFSA